VNFRKSIAILLCFVMFFSILLVAGCGQQAAKEPEPTPKEEPKKEPAKKMELAFAMHTAPGGPDQKAVQKFKELVESRTDEIVVNIFEGGTLGGERDNIEQLQTGEIAMTMVGEMPMNLYAAELFPMGVPYVFPSIETVKEAYNTEIGNRIKEKLEENKIKLIAWQRRGARMLTMNKAINTPDDLKGSKMRVPEIPDWVEVWKELGALPTPIAFPEVFGALQTGVVSGQENPLYLIESSKFAEVQSHVMITEHVHAIFNWMISKPFWDSLTAEQQKVVEQSAKEAADFGDKLTAELEEGYKKKLTEQGMTVIEVDKNLFKEKAMPAINRIKNKWAPGIYEEVQRITG